jgi:hypothetical protein
VIRCPVTKEINKEEKEHDRVAGDYASEKKISLLTVMEKKQKKIHALMQGQTIPFHAMFVIRVWDKTKRRPQRQGRGDQERHQLDERGAVFREQSAQHLEESVLPDVAGLDVGTLRASQALLRAPLSSPTCCRSPARSPDIWPPPRRFTMAPATISSASRRSPAVEGQSASPQHAVLLGMSGAGKSVTVCDLLTQTEGYFGYTVIIEEGLSYGIYTATVEEGARPIIIHPDGDLTINYLDTKGLPLTPDHLSAATALVARMIGTAHRRTNRCSGRRRSPNTSTCFTRIRFRIGARSGTTSCLRHRPARAGVAAIPRRTDAARARPPRNFCGLPRLEGRHPDEAESISAAFDEAEALKFLKEPKTSKEVRNLAFAYFTPEEFPTHRMLQELMMLDPMGAERDQIMEIATLILPWCRDGNYGCLFDGTSNLSLTGKIAHFELGYIPESAKELKAAAGFLITNHARKHIMTLPRAIRKRNVYEEVARFLDIPGGQEIVQESYAQLRKFNCWNISIVQQYARFKQSRIRSAVFGNSRQFFHHAAERPRGLGGHGQGHRAARGHAARDHELPAARPSEPARSIRRSPISTPTRRGTSAARFTTSRRRRCSIAPVRAASTSTAAPANFARVRASSKASSITPIADEKTNPNH